MTGRERIEAAFSADGARDLPAVICYENVLLRDHWARLTQHAQWHLHVSDADQHVAWIRDQFTAVRQDWMQMFPWANLEDEEHTTIKTGEQGVFRVHKHTGHREQLAGPPGSDWVARDGQPVEPDRVVESCEDIDASIPVPGEGECDQAAIEVRRRTARAVIEAFGQAVWPYRHVSGPLWKTYGLWGFEGMMTMIGARPELVRHACERYLAVAVRNVREAAEHGAAGVWIEDCLTDMISPDAFATLNVTYLRRLLDEIRAAGMKSIYYFCGNPAGKWDQILSLGMDALAMEEGKKNFSNQIDEIVERVQGRCVVLGNLDAFGVLERGSEQQLREEILRQVSAGRSNRSRFILSLGSPVTPATPLERVRLYCDMAHELGAG